jgi:hypothetical protein
LQGMIAGHCDLDILLDPFFLHFPAFREVSPWYPPGTQTDGHSQLDLCSSSAGCRRAVASPISTLHRQPPRIVDRASVK